MVAADLSKLSDEELIRGFTLACETNKLLAYEPYPWQREFHSMGADAKERLLICANGVGKTYSVAAELAMHCTGIYPEWWDGARLESGGFEVWIGSIDNEMQKIGLQESLMGPDLEEGIGTGFIPLRCIEKLNRRQSGIKDVLDEAFITHVSGKRVKLRFKTFEQGDKKWQSGKPKIIVWDEEPDENNVEQKNVFSEMQTRLVRNNGMFFGCRTPLYGMTALITHFMESQNDNVRWIGATWDDAPHMNSEARARVLAAYPEHQRSARSTGVPMMGEGGIFTTPESSFVVPPMQIPDHWARIKGIDFGLAHPAALACLAWDRDTGVKYLYDVWKDKIKRTAEHVEAINRREDWIPVAWPHDGEKRDPKSGARLADTYKTPPYNVTMLGKSARYKNDIGGAQAQWPIIETVRADLATGMLKVFSTCKPWLDEYRSYHIKDGQIMAVRDDCLKASFYAYMMLRFAVSKSQASYGDRNVVGMMPFTTAVR
jgi:phage terminase large subunit-like protein